MCGLYEPCSFIISGCLIWFSWNFDTFVKQVFIGFLKMEESSDAEVSGIRWKWK